MVKFVRLQREAKAGCTDGHTGCKEAPGQHPGHRLPLTSRVHLPSLSDQISKISGVAASVPVL